MNSPDIQVDLSWGDPREPEMFEGRKVLHINYREPPLHLGFKAFARKTADGGTAAIRVEPARDIRAKLGPDWERRARIYELVVAHIRHADADWSWKGVAGESADITVDESLVPSAGTVETERWQQGIRSFVGRFAPPPRVLAVQLVALACFALSGSAHAAPYRHFLLFLVIVLPLFSMALLIEHALKAYDSVAFMLCLAAVSWPKGKERPTRRVVVTQSLRTVWRTYRLKYLIAVLSAVGIIALTARA